MTEMQACMFIGTMFCLIASQYKEMRGVCLSYNLIGMIWFINGTLQYFSGWIK